MSFTALTTTELQTGKPVSTTTQNKIRTNFDDHEARIETLESGSAVDLPCITMTVTGPYGLLGTFTGTCYTTVNFSLNVTGVRLLIETAGTSGSTSFDIKKKSGSGAWTSILTTQPSLPSSAGDDSVSTNAVINTAVSLILAGDRLRLDLTGAQTNAVGFLARIDYTHA
jgi:hypothetical protein